MHLNVFGLGAIQPPTEVSSSKQELAQIEELKHNIGHMKSAIQELFNLATPQILEAVITSGPGPAISQAFYMGVVFALDLASVHPDWARNAADAVTQDNYRSINDETAFAKRLERHLAKLQILVEDYPLPAKEGLA